MFNYGFPKDWSTIKKLIWLKRFVAASPSWVWQLLTGVAPLTLLDAVAHPLHSLTQFGKCVQDGTPTPDAPVDIVTNNGAIKFDWHDIITTSQLSGYGTYVTPSNIAGNRAYRWFKDLPNGTYTFSVDGNYEIIVQWRDPADPSIPFPTPTPTPAPYENLTGWITSGEVTLDKTSGGYGIAVRRTSGTDSITPSNFDGTLHVQERGLYVDGTPEVLTVSADGAAPQTVNDVPMLLSVGDYADEGEIISGLLTHKVGIKVFDGTETVNVSSAGNAYITIDGVAIGAPNTPINTHFALETSTSSLAAGRARFGANGPTIYSTNYYMSHPTNRTAESFKAWLASEYANGTPVIVLYPLAEETTEQTTPHALHTTQGANVVDVSAAVSPVQLSVEYAKGGA